MKNRPLAFALRPDKAPNHGRVDEHADCRSTRYAVLVRFSCIHVGKQDSVLAACIKYKIASRREKKSERKRENCRREVADTRSARAFLTKRNIKSLLRKRAPLRPTRARARLNAPGHRGFQSATGLKCDQKSACNSRARYREAPPREKKRTHERIYRAAKFQLHYCCIALRCKKPHGFSRPARSRALFFCHLRYRENSISHELTFECCHSPFIPCIFIIKVSDTEESSLHEKLRSHKRSRFVSFMSDRCDWCDWIHGFKLIEIGFPPASRTCHG